MISVLTIFQLIDAVNDFNQRITYIMNPHKNSIVNNQALYELDDYDFGCKPIDDSALCTLVRYALNCRF